MAKKKHVVIIGAGFAGLTLARKLNNHPDYIVTLVDKNNYHQFQPLLYEVATASLDASNVSFPLRSIFRKSINVRIQITEISAIISEENKVEIPSGFIDYDYLVIAAGATTNYFRNKNIENSVFPMKSTLEALQLRNQLIRNLENAAFTKGEDNIRKLLTIVVVGGGPTGIELSGALAEMKNDILPKEYPELNFKNMKIYLVEGSDKVLGTMSESASIHSKKYLEEMGVIVKTKTFVEDYDGNQLVLKGGAIIQTSMVIWAAGVKAVILPGLNKEKLSADSRIRVDSFNKVIGSENIFALGDIAFVENKNYSKGLPQLASVAIDQAKNLAENFKRIAKGKIIKEYKYHDKSSMATIGKNKAVVDFVKPRVSFKGFAAWFIWMTIHLILLLTFKNKILVFINWVYKYFTNSNSLLLLFPSFSNKKNRIKQPSEVP